MATPKTSAHPDPTSHLRDPDHWRTGQEAMTPAQDSYLHTLAEQAGESLPDTLTKAEASKRIETLRDQVGLTESAGHTAPAPAPSAGTGLQKDPSLWTTGKEPMTAAQSSYLHTLAEQAGKPVAEELTKAEAAKQIESLKEQTGRGT